MLDKIICGDCLEVMREMPDASVDCIITDPPFKVSQKYGGGVDADNLTAVSSIIRTIPEMSRVLKPNRFAVIFYDNRILPFLFEATKGTPLVYRKMIFLYRRWGNANRWCGWMQTTDPICIFINGYDKPFMPKIKGKVTHDVYVKEGPELFNAEHVAQKPLALIENIVTWCSDVGDIIFDPYAGSGTVAAACINLNRHYICIEKEPEYCDIAEKRLAEML